ncbi:Holliday junction resolvase RuvX [Blattabacterium cuenoti]|uniref:Holliday junction resolvase RuvX n=1 Tax=Blattabacterium cuenoti TaxID=1653831 RepID=UPI00163CA05B|nr:Holliday junction resolvase RuvX [Blattabacterium cuenoti]
MTKILGMDYGKKMTGLSITDSKKKFAFGLDVIPTNKLMNFLKSFLNDNSIEKIVIGLPKKLNFEEFPIEKHIKKFIFKFCLQYPRISIERLDERFTSKIALYTIIKSGIKKKKRRKKEISHKISAIIILQSYLNKISLIL